VKKVRLDNLLVHKGLVLSREKARSLILEGKVFVNEVKTDKAGKLIDPNSVLRIIKKIPYVSRGGIKLEEALKFFHIDVRGTVAMDIGASTGGFTDCLLQHGAEKVFAVDVGYGQLAWILRKDNRVVTLEKTNIRHLEQEAVTDAIDIATIDVSFISLLKVIPRVNEFMTPEGKIIALIKPQFEVERKDIGKGGVVREDKKRKEVIDKIIKNVCQLGFKVKGVMQSPVVGPKGNIEYFIYIKRSSQ
jgi:23S rRNA (cytidine1920-2'-O)/16S rRNA (cytidine1409-2'-O)-methyltransferase